MPNSIITELQAAGSVYDIHGKATINSNSNTSQAPIPTPSIFDWVGTQQQYVDQAIETNHPEWICFIVDDVEGGYSVYTKTEIDNAVVHKAGDETITGEKRFSNVIHRKNSSVTRTGTYTSDQLIFLNHQKSHPIQQNPYYYPNLSFPHQSNRLNSNRNSL